MCSALGGRAAEQLIFGKISTGALSDLEKVTKQAYAMVSIYGLNARVGNISYYDSQGRDMFTKPYSEDTARVIDEEVSKVVEGQYQRALKTLEDHKDKLTLLAEKLLTHEVIFKEDLVEVFGKREWDKEEEPQVDTPKPDDSILLEATVPHLDTDEALDSSDEATVEKTNETSEIPPAES
jgi:cell division protease FtsH